VIASGSYPEVITQFATRIHPSVEVIGTRLGWDVNDVASGLIDGPVSYGMVKAARVNEWLNGEPLDLAYGDSDADIHMLLIAKQAVAVHPADKRLAAAARQHGWRVVV
jgi:phosphoserine phosphatase